MEGALEAAGVVNFVAVVVGGEGIAALPAVVQVGGGHEVRLGGDDDTAAATAATDHSAAAVALGAEGWQNEDGHGNLTFAALASPRVI